MDRKCSNCGNVGHNSRTCPGLWLFGVQRHVSSPSAVATTKNVSMNCLDLSPSSLSSSRASTKENFDKPADGYISDGSFPGVEEKQKRIPWTEEEHRSFLVGLEKLGNSWTRISREYVTTRTPAQVNSHAQNYFLRQNALVNNRRSRLSDTVESIETKQNPTAKSKNPASFLAGLTSSCDSSTVLLNNFHVHQLRSSVESTTVPNLELALAHPNILRTSKSKFRTRFCYYLRGGKSL